MLLGVSTKIKNGLKKTKKNKRNNNNSSEIDRKQKEKARDSNRIFRLCLKERKKDHGGGQINKSFSVASLLQVAARYSAADE